jgi:hypothetical protein
MMLINTSLMNQVKEGSVAPLEAYMKAANKAAFAHFLKPGDLERGHQGPETPCGQSRIREEPVPLSASKAGKDATSFLISQYTASGS